MGQPDLNRLERAMSGLTVGVVKSMQRYQERAYEDGLIEREEQFHIHVTGRAEEFAVWTVTEVDFGLVFVDATAQRDSPFDRPHFTYGAVVETLDPVGLMASVMDWKTTDRNETIGAKVAIGVVGTDRAVKFEAAIHASFQGFAVPLNTFPDEDIGVPE